MKNTIAKKTSKFILDLIFPINCLGCDKEGEWLCHDCLQKVPFMRQICFNCKEETKFGEFCPKCKNDYALDGVIVASDYQANIIKKLVRACKYQFVKDLGPVLGSLLIMFSGEYLSDRGDLIGEKDTPSVFDCWNGNLVIPVPLSKKRLNWRGFNQSEMIAKQFADYFNLKVNTTDLKRIKHGRPQAGLSKEKRKNNLQEAFEWKGRSLVGKNIILIDDVVTTASTLNECAKALKKNNAEEVWGLVAAKG